MKTLSGNYYRCTNNNSSKKKNPTTTTTKYRPIQISSTNSNVRNVISKCVRWNRRNWFLINKTLAKKKTTIYQTAILYWNRQEKQRTPFRACVPSSHRLQQLKVVLMWGLFIELDIFTCANIFRLLVLSI